ncbi:hypothetical protein ES703_125989 [subsurface metagenome]
MLVQYGAGVTDARGSIGGSTFSRNRFGGYVRARTVPVNPRSPRQTGIRAIVMYLAEQWRESPMDDAKRAAWELYADSVNWQNKLGQTVHLTGFNMFMRSNLALISSGSALVSAGPIDFSLPANDESATFEYTTGAKNDLTFDDGAPWVSEDGAGMLIYAGMPQNNSRTFFNGPWRYFYRILGDSGAPPSTPSTGQVWPWIPGIGNKLWMKIRIHRVDGRLSNEFILPPFTVVA